MKLAELVREMPGAELHGGAELEVSRVIHDSRRCEEGCLFVAIPGLAADGNAFVEAAMKKGAVAVVSEEAPRPGTPWVRVDDAREALALFSAAALGHPGQQLDLVGVTGTNGKTTTTYMIDAALREAGETTGLLGTVDYRIGDRVAEAVRTTPEASDLQSLLRQMVDAGCRRAVPGSRCSWSKTRSRGRHLDPASRLRDRRSGWRPRRCRRCTTRPPDRPAPAAAACPVGARRRGRRRRTS